MENKNEITAYTPGVVVRDTENDALMSMDYDNILALADRADNMVNALNKIMAAALKITTAKDWVLIGGTPYLQETGATKVARLFGISTKIHDGYPRVERDSSGYPTYIYRMTFSMGSQSIEADGMRSAADDFFAGKGDKKKKLDEIPLDDVQRSAYTNCMNNGIKRLIPGLRNIDVSDLQSAGIDVNNSKGYTFKPGSRGGNTGKAEESGIVCSHCGTSITQRVASYSQGQYGAALCLKCQGLAKTGQLQPQDDDTELLPWENGGEG